jgi:hypothetical protein
MSTILDSDEILSRLFGSVSRARILELLVSQAGRAFYQREIREKALGSDLTY